MEEKLEIKYLIEAQDRATKVLEKIDKSLQNVQNSMIEVDKAQERVEDSSNGMGARFKSVIQSVDALFNTFKNFWDFLQAFDFKKLERMLLILGFMAKLKGFDSISTVLFGAAKQIDILSFQFEKLNTVITKTQEKYGTFTNALLQITGLNTLADGLWGVTKRVAGLGLAFVALSSSETVVRNLRDGALLLTSVFTKVDFVIGDLMLKFPKYVTLLNVAADGTNLLHSAAWKTYEAFKGTNTVLNKTLDATKSVGSTFAKAAGHTEIFERGLFGLVTRGTTLAAIFSTLGTSMVLSDSMMTKMAGVTLVALALAFGGVATVVRQVVIKMGELIYDIGTSLVGAMQSSVQKMNKLKDATYTFGFVLEGLNRETKGTVGTFEEWNAIIGEFSRKTGYSLTTIQKSVSELTRFGESIGLTKSQMQELLPVIGDVAEANHTDLFNSTIAVVEALSGQTVMLGNMGISLGAHSKAVHKASEAAKVHYEKLDDSQKAQIRYNALIIESKKIQGVAEASVNTMTGAIRRQETAQEKLSLAIGSGAEIIERQYVSQLAWATDMLQQFSEPLLKVSGFVGALTGRFMQGAGIALQWSFSIVLLTSSIGALNIVLKNAYVSQFLVDISKSVFLTKSLASVMPNLAGTLSTFLGLLGTSGAGLKTFLVTARLAFVGAAKAAIALLAPVALIAAKVAIVVGIIYVLYKAFALIEEKTKVFSSIADSFKKWWDMPGLIEMLGAGLKTLVLILIDGVRNAIVSVAQSMVSLYSVFLEFRIVGITAIQGIIDFFSMLKSAAIDTWRVLTNGLISVGEGILSVIGGSDAMAAGLEKLKMATETTAKSQMGLNEEQKNTISGIEAQILQNDALIVSLGQVNEATQNGASGGAEGIIAQHEQELSLIQLFNEAKEQMALDTEERKALFNEVANANHYALLVDAFGKEEALMKVQEIKKQMAQIKSAKDEVEREKQKMELIKKINEQAVNAQKQIDKQKIDQDRATRQVMYSTAENFLQAGMMLSKAGSAQYKALAIASATMSTYRAAAQALADPLVPTWMKPVAVASTIALGLAQVSKIVSAKSYFKGGIVEGPSVGDKKTINVNGGEAVYTKSQQRELYSMAQGNGNSGRNETAEALNNLAAAIMNQKNIIEIDGREIARTVRKELAGGFQLA